MLLDKKLLLLFDFMAQFFLCWHVGHVFGGIYLVAIVQNRISGDSAVGIGAEQHADGGLVVAAAHKVVVHTHVHIKLTNILMREFVSFEFENDKPLHLEVVEYEVDVEIVGVGNNMLLSFHKSKASAQFENKLFKIIDKSLFEFPCAPHIF